jgi:hypothetical protein
VSSHVSPRTCIRHQDLALGNHVGHDGRVLVAEAQANSNVFLPALACVLIALVGIDFMTVRRCRRNLRSWAQQHGYQLVSARRASWHRVRLPVHGLCHTFKLVVTSPSGQSHQGVAALGGGTGGMAAQILDISWA